MLASRTFAFDERDGVERRREKQAIFVVASACTIAGVVWCAMYWAVFGWGLTTALPLAFVVIVGSALALSQVTKNHRYAVYAQIVCIVYITAGIQWSIGGVFDSGFVLAWAFVGPVAALFFFPLRTAVIWFLLYVANVAITLAFDDYFQAHGLEVSDTVRHLFFAMNLCVSSLVVLLFAAYYVYSAQTEHQRAEALQHDLDEVRAKQLGPYTVEEKLGQGGMGVVYLARHELLRRPTAIKLLSTADASADDLARFELEVRKTSELTHPNVVAVYDYGRSDDGEFYYAMEYLPGIDLESLVSAWGPLPIGRAVSILVQICAALDEAHHRGLIHRDIKPANIILSRIGKRVDVAKVVDFGLVKDVEAPSELTARNHIAGTPAYLAPEALVDPEQIGPRSDIYAVGAVAFFLLTGEKLFTGRTLAELCAHHIHTPPRAPSEVGEGIPAELDAIILRCLAKQPSDRWASASDLGDALTTLELPRRWQRRDAMDWWDAYDAAPPPRAAATGHTSTVTVGPRGRAAIPEAG